MYLSFYIICKIVYYLFMKTLKEYLRDINISASLLEASILDEIEDTLSAGDVLEKEFKEAERVWNLFTKKQKVKKAANVISNIYKLHIESGPLAKYLCRGINGLDISDLEFVDIEFETDDVLWSREHCISIQVASKYHIKVKATRIKYDDGKNASEIMPIKDAIKLITNNIATSKYLQDLETVKSEFMKHVTYIRK